MDKLKTTKYTVWILTFIWMTLIFYFSQQPADISRVQSGEILVKMNIIEAREVTEIEDRKIFKLQRVIRKSAHFIEYFGLGVLVFLSVYLYKMDKSISNYKECTSNNWNIATNAIFSWLLCTLYAITDEIHQYFIPGRGPMVRDVYLDSLSSLSAILFIVTIMFTVKVGALRIKRSDLKSTN